jgi:hypothetical protein
MSLVLELVLVLVVVVVVAMLVANGVDKSRRAQITWRVVNRTQPDDTIVVGVERGDEFRQVKAIPPAETTDVVADLRLAREDAALLAEELNTES